MVMPSGRVVATWGLKADAFITLLDNCGWSELEIGKLEYQLALQGIEVQTAAARSKSNFFLLMRNLAALISFTHAVRAHSGRRKGLLATHSKSLL